MNVDFYGVCLFTDITQLLICSNTQTKYYVKCIEEYEYSFEEVSIA